MVRKRGRNGSFILPAMGLLALCVIYVAIAGSCSNSKAKIDANQIISPWDTSNAPPQVAIHIIQKNATPKQASTSFIGQRPSKVHRAAEAMRVAKSNMDLDPVSR